MSENKPNMISTKSRVIPIFINFIKCENKIFKVEEDEKPLSFKIYYGDNIKFDKLIKIDKEHIKIITSRLRDNILVLLKTL